jgi:hypothetical protein
MKKIKKAHKKSSTVRVSKVRSTKVSPVIQFGVVFVMIAAFALVAYAAHVAFPMY